MVELVEASSAELDPAVVVDVAAVEPVGGRATLGRFPAVHRGRKLVVVVAQLPQRTGRNESSADFFDGVRRSTSPSPLLAGLLVAIPEPVLSATPVSAREPAEGSPARRSGLRSSAVASRRCDGLFEIL